MSEAGNDKVTPDRIKKPDRLQKLSPEQEKALEQDSSHILPLLEHAIHDFTRLEYYSFRNNEFLRSQWHQYVTRVRDATVAEERRQPSRFFDLSAARDYHFYKYDVKYKPSESIFRRRNFRKILNCDPNARHDDERELPVPQELLIKTVPVNRKYPKKYNKENENVNVSGNKKAVNRKK